VTNPRPLRAYDRAWQRRLRRGDPAAVEQLADEMLRPLYGFCLYRVGGDRHLCEEVVQETFLRAISDADRYEPRRARGDIFPWLCGLARNEIARTLARERMTPVRDPGQPARRLSLEMLWDRLDEELLESLARLDREPLAADVLDRRETRELVGAAMTQIPLRHRQVLEARYLQDRSLREIATAMAQSEKAVESLLARARQTFRAAFLALTDHLNPGGAPQR
jgi:RNA polymerase sigma-70 factor (ECF subfamily)